jgi:ribosomal protein L6P/L9E
MAKKKRKSNAGRPVVNGSVSRDVQLSVGVTTEMSREIGKLAGEVGMSKSELSYHLLEFSLQDNALIVRAVKHALDARKSLIDSFAKNRGLNPSAIGGVS